MITYILKSTACLALLLFFYHLVLEKEKMHQFNRFYLLTGVIVSFIIPLITITTITYVEPTVFNTTEIAELPIGIDNSAPIMENKVDVYQMLIAFYILVVAILLIRFGINIYKIFRKIKTNKRLKLNNSILVLVDDKILPHTFWNYIFINKEDYFDENIEEELFTHELTHATQKHTLDVLLIEFLHALFWINPLFIFVKKAMQLNHEFLADEHVIDTHNNTIKYQQLLVNKAAWKNEYYLASNLNYLVTKKRLKMMTTQSSPKKLLLKKLAVIPLLAGFFFLFAERVEAQKIIEVQEIVEEKEEPIETIYEQESKLQLDYSKSDIYKEYVYRNGKFSFKDKNGNKISKKYSELTKEEKSKLLPPPPLKTKKKIPSQKLIEKLKDGKKYAVWIDGKVVKNEILNNYKASDFARYSNSFVHKNARSKRFPQEYQASLETKKYFIAKNNKRVNAFLKYLKEKHNIEEIEEVQEVKEEPKIIEIKELKKKNNSPSSNGSKQNVIKKGDIRLKLKEINGLKPEFVKDTTDISFNKGWYITIDGQKYFYTFDKKERIARYYRDGKLVDLDIVKEYNRKYVKYEKLRNSGKHYVFKTKEEQQEIDKEFSDLGGMYFRMSRNDKRKVKRPENRIKPYVKLKQGNKVWYKKPEDLTEDEKKLLPPPPPRHNASTNEKENYKLKLKEWSSKVNN